MESIGLMPSDTGEPGGKRTGQRMSDYPIEGGAFYLQCVVFAHYSLSEKNRLLDGLWLWLFSLHP